MKVEEEIEGQCRKVKGVSDTYRIIIAESKAETESLVEIEGVVIENTDVHLPFFEVVGGDEADAWRKGFIDLKGMRLYSGVLLKGFRKTDFNELLQRDIGQCGSSYPSCKLGSSVPCLDALLQMFRP